MPKQIILIGSRRDYPSPANQQLYARTTVLEAGPSTVIFVSWLNCIGREVEIIIGTTLEF